MSHHRDLVDAEFAINEGGGGNMRKGKYLTNEVQASEKVYQDFKLEVTNSGGHSSLPVKDNAIYHLAQGLARLAAFEFPAQLNEITRGYFERSARGRDAIPPIAADMQRRGSVPRRIAVAAARLSAQAALLELDDADDVRGDAARGRARQQRAAAARHRQRQLPHPAGRQPESVKQTIVDTLARSEGRRLAGRRGAPEPAGARSAPTS